MHPRPTRAIGEDCVHKAPRSISEALFANLTLVRRPESIIEERQPY